MTPDDSLLAIRDLAVHYPTRHAGNAAGGIVRAIDGVDLTVRAGRTLAVVGESGCGKSTLGYAVLGMVQATHGHIYYEGRELTAMTRKQRRSMARELQIVFQDPHAALDPRMSIGASIAEPLEIHGVSRNDGAQRVAKLMDLVGLPASYRDRRPDALSGGQRQRVVIARALALSPRLLICDEPVSALDVSIRSQILNLLMALQQELGLTYLFISHDLSVVRHIADDVAVMYLGRIAEQGPTDMLFSRARHPYTQALLSTIPLPDPVAQRARQKIILAGEPPSRFSEVQGCPFYSRCSIREARCANQRPRLVGAADGLSTACLVRAVGGGLG